MTKLSLVHWHDHGCETDTDASQGATSVHVVDVLRASLQGAPKTEDNGADEDGDLSAELVTCWAGEEGSYEGSAREDRDDGAAGI